MHVVEVILHILVVPGNSRLQFTQISRLGNTIDTNNTIVLIVTFMLKEKERNSTHICN